MKELLIYPAFAIFFLGFAMQMVDIAESTSAKTISFADDMNNAMDCATKGIDLTVCSPNLMNHDFKPEINKTIQANKDLMNTVQLRNKELETNIKASNLQASLQESANNKPIIIVVR